MAFACKAPAVFFQIARTHDGDVYIHVVGLQLLDGGEHNKHAFVGDEAGGEEYVQFAIGFVIESALDRFRIRKIALIHPGCRVDKCPAFLVAEKVIPVK
ncbi:hypothetical protein D3C79_970880 [compost metagenome]